MRGFRRALALAGLVSLVLAPAASASASWSVVSSPTLVLPWAQLWPVLLGGLVPLVTYALNHWAPWVSQPIKAVVLVVLSAVVAALYTALATDVFGLNAATVQLVLTGVAGALAAHHLLWKPSGISTLLGAYADYGLRKQDGKLGPPTPLPTTVQVGPDGRPLPSRAPVPPVPPPSGPGPGV